MGCSWLIGDGGGKSRVQSLGNFLNFVRAVNIVAGHFRGRVSQKFLGMFRVEFAVDPRGDGVPNLVGSELL